MLAPSYPLSAQLLKQVSLKEKFSTTSATSPKAWLTDFAWVDQASHRTVNS